ncbi:MAG: hypothetical protein HY903_15295 [Deltaproteobacteria bacterium]|nr:hypothetical protein [Deltaproteobacteria bacterium]
MMMLSLSLSLWLCVSGAGEADAEVAEALRLLAEDPPIADVQRAALEHFSVSHDDLSSYRAAARLRALLPSLTGGYLQGDNKLRRSSADQAAGFSYDPNNPQVTDNTNGVDRAFTAAATWSLGSLVFDANQIETYSLVGIQQDLLTEVTRLYYTRQHNVLALALEPPRDPRARAALMLRSREIEAMLDALTGGAWSKLRRKGR